MLVWLIVVPVLAGLWAQRRVARTFGRFDAVANRTGVTGRQAAELLLARHGLSSVPVEVVNGVLTDHFDPVDHVLWLSPEVAGTASVAALGIAAHEVGHACQQADGSRAFRARGRLAATLTQWAPWAGPVLIGGFWFGDPALIALSCLYMAALCVFSIITLPVELGASRRALEGLAASHLAQADELPEIRRVLKAAAFTYVAGTVQQLAFFLFALGVSIAAFGHGR